MLSELWNLNFIHQIKSCPYFILLTLLYSYLRRYVDTVELARVSKLGRYLTGMTHI